MNAYQSQPTVLKDGWYHVCWVWRDTPDCSTNHDLSYMKSPDLKNWFNAFGKPLNLPATIDKKLVIVDPIPPKGEIINLAARLCLDENNRPLFVYHKYDSAGNLQLYVAKTKDGKWVSHKITNWNYRWEFSGNGSINSEVVLKDFRKRPDGFYEVSYWHIKYGSGTILLNRNFENVGKVLKPKSFSSQLKIEGDFPGLLIRTSEDLGNAKEPGVRYLLKWETINHNRDRPRKKPWPGPSDLYLFKLKKNK